MGDRAYWVSDIQTQVKALGQIDVVSSGLGFTDAPVPVKTTKVGTQSGTFSPLNPYTQETRKLAKPVAAKKENALKITATNIRAITVDPKCAGLDCNAAISVDTGGPLAVTLDGCGVRPSRRHTRRRRSLTTAPSRISSGGSATAICSSRCRFLRSRATCQRCPCCRPCGSRPTKRTPLPERRREPRGHRALTGSVAGSSFGAQDELSSPDADRRLSAWRENPASRQGSPGRMLPRPVPGRSGSPGRSRTPRSRANRWTSIRRGDEDRERGNGGM